MLENALKILYILMNEFFIFVLAPHAKDLKDYFATDASEIWIIVDTKSHLFTEMLSLFQDSASTMTMEAQEINTKLWARV